MYNEIPQPLRFYSDLDYKIFNRRIINGISERPVLICSGVRLMPFELIRTPILQTDLTINIVNKRTNISTDITSLLSDYITIYEDNENDTEYIRFFSNDDFSEISKGVYDLRITDGTNNWYSEYFKIENTTDTLQFEYWNTIDIGNIIYQNNYKNRFNIRAFKSDTGEYETYKETIETRNKDIYQTFSRKDKLWQIQFFANSYLYDAIQYMEMHDNIYLTDITGEQSEIQINSIESEQISGTDYLSITLKFKIIDNKFQVSPDDVNLNIKERVIESGIYRGKKKLYRGTKKIIR